MKDHTDHRGGAAVRICVRVAYCKALEIQDKVLPRSIGVHYLLGQSGHVVSSVRFRGNVQRIGVVLYVLNTAREIKSEGSVCRTSEHTRKTN